MSILNRRGWIGVDLDGTLAVYEPTPVWDGSIGAPVSEMIERVRRWLAEGRDVRIFTARVAPCAGVTDGPRAIDVQWRLIEDWCRTHLGTALPITATKDYDLVEFWDDRCVEVVRNTGRRRVQP